MGLSRIMLRYNGITVKNAEVIKINLKPYSPTWAIWYLARPLDSKIDTDKMYLEGYI
ncbi:MAG: hypothetical protein GY702_09535 [Desulfobulbaceae bacterium]|nr:hypothetical protein [Desulfobulbaceae bacterium]